MEQESYDISEEDSQSSYESYYSLSQQEQEKEDDIDQYAVQKPKKNDLYDLSEINREFPHFSKEDFLASFHPQSLF